MVVIGDKVKMSDELKNNLIENECEDHVIEFGKCEGIVESWVDKNDKLVYVRWKPSNLKYSYLLDMLDKI